MFTGIIETLGTVELIESAGSNISFFIRSTITHELKVDQSVAHNGCCLTIEEIEGALYKVTAIGETLAKTQLGDWSPGSKINIERCMVLGARLDGHMVQGHVDTVGKVEEIENKNGSYLVSVSYEKGDDRLTVPQGSITVNGISLTVAKSGSRDFSVAIIPYTWEHTNMQYIRKGDRVNLEFDIIGKYLSVLIKNRDGII
ncbi:MAG: riboflavin synthase [Bergeyella sp.]|nr:riboflavin synthase [Bergeyella sp.]